MSRDEEKFGRNDRRRTGFSPRTRETYEVPEKEYKPSSGAHRRTKSRRFYRDREEKYYSEESDDSSTTVTYHNRTSYRNRSGDTFNKDHKRSTLNFSETARSRTDEASYHNKKYKTTYVIPDGKRSQTDAEEGKRVGVRYVGFKYLRDLSEKEIAQITCEILNIDSPFSSFLEKKDLQVDWLFLIVKIVAKVCALEFRDTRNAILNQICRSEFLHAVSYYLGEVNLETRKPTIEKLPSFVSDLIEFYSSVINFLPAVAVDKNINKLIAKTKRAVDSMNVDHNLNVDENLLPRLNILVEKFEDYKKLLENPPKFVETRTHLQDLSERPPPDSFRDLDLYPTHEDLTRHSFGFIRPNKIKGAYDHVEHYLDVQFRLFREDFIDPLRQGLNKYREAKLNTEKAELKFKYEGLRLYPNCKFLEVKETRTNELAFLLDFNRNRRLKIKWEYSKRFMYGSLLLFTNNEFRTFFFGTVSDRDIKLLNEGKILVTFPNDVQANENLLSENFLMAESEVFFEPYFLVMKSLKTLNANNFPMTKYIVAGESKSAVPRYMTKDILWTVSEFAVDPFETQRWPGPKQLGLDLHQHRAFQKALTSEFCVIQGPPGTGKTFISLKIVQVLLQNVKLNPNRIRLPLLIVCYTNHALDQFLEGILKHTNKIIRVGSQSKSEILKNYNLRGRNQQTIRHSAAAKKELSPAFANVRFEVKSNFDTVNRVKALKDTIENPVGILKYDLLKNAMNKDQKNILSCGKSLQDWLLETRNESVPNREMRGRRRNAASAELADDNRSEAMEIDLREFDEEHEDCHVIDEDDLFETDSAGQNDDISHEVTVDELATKCTNLIDRYWGLKKLDDNHIDDFDAYHRELRALETEIEIVARKHDVLTQQLENPNYTVGKSTSRRVDVRDLSLPERWKLYWSWVKVLHDNVIQELQDAEVKYRNSLSQYEDVKQMEDLYVVQQADILGMTTTCAARFHTLLSALKPAIVLVEEAAEVLETHIVTSLTKSCQHVILIGDHKQLKPSSAVYKLSKDYNIDVSLFERMINNGMDCPMLNVQHRMRPEISSLITPLIYLDLKNDQSVFAYENIRGMTKNLFFLDHNCYEQDVEDTSSRKNIFEADFLIELCRYLVLQGYDPEEITMLTTYTGQMYLLREKKRDCQLIQQVKCIVVDRYQGEENDIILLSLVRSNEKAKIGFLATQNRVCVALSRARKGFYIVGNMDNLTKSSPNLWGKIAENLRKQNAIGKEMRLLCPRHEIPTLVSCPKDFDKVREGGCSRPCGELLQCGHSCERVCHALDREHKQVRCHEECGRRCSREKHECKKLCFEDCGRCVEGMVWTLGCGHTKTLACHVDEKTYLCDTVVDDVSPLCRHKIQRLCHEEPEDVSCPHPCEDRLECGHRCENKCHKKVDPDHVEFKCKKPCSKQNRLCSREHQCQKSCFEECDICTIKITVTLKCGHEKSIPCSTPIQSVKCVEECESICSDCKQKCRKKCYQNCFPCERKVEKRISECGHRVKIPCHIQPEREHCEEPCERLLRCGHKCAAKCCQPCDSKTCTELVKLYGNRGICGHNFVNVPCHQKARSFDEETLQGFLVYCDVPCDARLKCGDPCAGTCGRCWQGRLHEACQKDCGSINFCGHRCKYPCQQMCPPCTEPCGFRCVHSKCPKKCGAPCVPCNEPCAWRCPHRRCTKKCGEICDREPCNEACPSILKCGHPCIGYCGEPCPPKCRYCENEITKIVLGFKDEADARFVFLVDCEHTIESKALEHHLNIASQDGKVLTIACPLCGTPITRTLRYMNQVKRTYSDIMEIKLLIFGTKKTLMEKRRGLQRNILQFNSSSVKNIAATGLQKMREMCDEYLLKVDVVKNKMNTISSVELNTIDFFYKTFVDINSRLGGLYKYGVRNTKSDVVSENIVQYIQSLLARMHEPATHLNRQLSEDLALELRRYHKMVDYSLLVRHPSYLARMNDATVKLLVHKLKNDIFGVKRFDLVENVVLKTFDDLQEILKVSDLIVDDGGLLPKSVQKFVMLIHQRGFDEREMESAEIQIMNLKNEPIGRVSEKQIQKAYEILKRLKDCVKKQIPGVTGLETMINRSTKDYYNLIPHDFGTLEPPLLDTLEAIQEETKLLDSLMMADKRYLEIDSYYQKLKTKLRPLDREEERFKILKTYFDNTSGQSRKIIEIFEVERQGEDERFMPYKKLYRKLLWHGSRFLNFSGILAEGLRIAPHGVAHGASFGTGIYFADMAAKSIGYCQTCSNANNTLVILLCEVALGQIQDLSTRGANTGQQFIGHNSVKAGGSMEPDPQMNKVLEDGVEIALGKGVTLSKPSCVGGYSEIRVPVEYEPFLEKIYFLKEMFPDILFPMKRKSK